VGPTFLLSNAISIEKITEIGYLYEKLSSLQLVATLTKVVLTLAPWVMK
jgi:hypothetical protein